MKINGLEDSPNGVAMIEIYFIKIQRNLNVFMSLLSAIKLSINLVQILGLRVVSILS